MGVFKCSDLIFKAKNQINLMHMISLSECQSGRETFLMINFILIRFYLVRICPAFLGPLILQGFSFGCKNLLNFTCLTINSTTATTLVSILKVLGTVHSLFRRAMKRFKNIVKTSTGQQDSINITFFDSRLEFV